LLLADTEIYGAGHRLYALPWFTKHLKHLW